MFKKSRRKIVAAILSVLILLLLGTFVVIYFSSYVDMTNENQEMLRQYVNEYTLFDNFIGKPDGSNPKNRPGSPYALPPKRELSTFYSVAISKDGNVLRTDTADISTIGEDELTEIARDILSSGKTDGIQGTLIYQTADKGGYFLVAFLDNTVMLENASTLINYTLIFGGVALVLLFFLARYLADRIVTPLEENYQKQRQFISDAGHELKTPVAIVNTNIEILSREIGENQWLSNIQYESERMSALITQLLDLAKAENITPQLEAVNLSRLVYGEMLPFETVAYENGLIINSNITENIWVNGNSVQLKQLISILLDNAIQHGGSGKEIDLTLKKEKNQATLSVANAGDAIPPEQKELLFERFYRMDAARTGVNNQYGLGLAIAKAITVTHKGSIYVWCYDGKVEFTAQIPLQK